MRVVVADCITHGPRRDWAARMPWSKEDKVEEEERKERKERRKKGLTLGAASAGAVQKFVTASNDGEYGTLKRPFRRRSRLG